MMGQYGIMGDGTIGCEHSHSHSTQNLQYPNKSRPLTHVRYEGLIDATHTHCPH